VTGILAAVVVYGTVFGLTYVLIALGFTLLFGVSRVLNLTYGALYMVTAYLVYYFAAQLGMNLVLSTVLAVGITAAVGVGVFLLVARLAPDPMRFLIVTIFVALLLQYLFEYLYPAGVELVPGLVSIHGILIFGVSMSPTYLVAGAVTVVLLVLLWVWIDWTSYGHAVRATAEDPETAALFGIRVRRVYLVVVAVSSVLVAIAAVLIVPAQEATPTMWVEPFVIAFVVSIVGGLGNFKWTIPAAFLVSFTQFYVVFAFPATAGAQDIVAFLVAIGFIIVLPRGIGGIARAA
jgi:branched-subunit amino acid ABC-type transport system permease component